MSLVAPSVTNRVQKGCGAICPQQKKESYLLEDLLSSANVKANGRRLHKVHSGSVGELLPWETFLDFLPGHDDGRDDE